MDVSNILVKAVMILVPMILSLSVHEYAHARVAYWLGDDTASRMGRLTLNPLSHIDLFGTILLPLISISTGFSLFGWAKPVPVSPYRLTRKMTMYKGMVLVAVAGPLSNLVLAIVCGLVLHALGATGAAAPRNAEAAGVFLTMVFFMNIGLAVFNMLPVPPLDGSRLLPPALQEKMQRYTLLVFIGFLVLFNVGANLLIWPIQLIAGAVLYLTGLPFGVG